MSHQYAEWGQSSWNDWWWQELQTEVARLGRGRNELRQRVLEVEGVNASQLDRITELTRELEEGEEWRRRCGTRADAGQRCRGRRETRDRSAEGGSSIYRRRRERHL